MTRDELFDKYFCNEKLYEDCEERDCEKCREEFYRDFDAAVKEENKG